MNKESSYIKYLPAIYQGASLEEASFLGRFLNAFENILSGINDTLDYFADFFQPEKAQEHFLPWLAGWVALTLKETEEWDIQRNRELIGQIVQLYQKRGTREGLEEYLKIYVKEQVYIYEDLAPMQIGVSCAIGSDTILGEAPPYFFRIYMKLAAPNLEIYKKRKQSLIEIIDREKPAHTYYSLTIKIPTMQVGVDSTVGEDTLLGGLTV